MYTKGKKEDSIKITQQKSGPLAIVHRPLAIVHTHTETCYDRHNKTKTIQRI